MRKPDTPLLVVITALFAVFLLGFLAGRGLRSDSVTVNVSQKILTEPTRKQEPAEEPESPKTRVSFPIDINRAGKEELMALPGIGEVLAERILSYREQNGAFSTVEELLNVEGIGKEKLDKIWDLIMIGG